MIILDNSLVSLNKINIVVLKNPFDLSTKTLYSTSFIEGFTIRDYISPYTIGISSPVVSLNGKAIAEEELDLTFPQEGDCIALCSQIQGGGDKNPLAMIASIALAVFVGGIQPGFWGITNKFALGLVQAGLMLVGGSIIQALFPIPKADLGNTATNQSYGWGGPVAIQGQGGALARTYGTFKTAGTLIGQHITTDGTKQYLNLLYTGGEGPCAKLENIQLDGNPISNFHDIDHDIRLGYNIQPPISFFDYTSADQTFSYELALGGGWSTQRTEGDGGEALEFTLSFPNGLCHINDSGNSENAKVECEVQYKKVGDVNWATFSDTVLTTKKMYYDSATGTHYELNSSDIMEVFNGGGDSPSSNFFVKSHDEQGNVVPGNMLATIDVKVYEQQAKITVEDNQSSSFFVTKKIDKLPKGQYDLRMRCSYKSGEGSRFSTRVYFASLSHIIYKKFSRPRKILLAIRALATDQLNGNIPTVTWEQTAENVWAFNPDSGYYEEHPSSNPAWACYDMLHAAKKLQSPYDKTWGFHVFGCKKERMSYYSFKAWADRCDEKKHSFNYCFTNTLDMWEALKLPETSGRGKIVMKGTTFSCVFDAPKTPKQLFSIGNTVKDSFTEDFLDTKSRANCVEVSFFNKEKNGEKDVAIAYGSNWDTDPQNPTQVSLDGCNNYAEAFQYASFLVRCNEHFIRTVSFSADTDAIVSQVGDAIYFQNDTFNWGYGGRLEEFTQNTVTLNNPALMEQGKSYVLKIRRKNGEIFESLVSPVAETKEVTVITLTTPFTDLPHIYDPYAFGEVGKDVKQLIISSVSRGSSMTKKLTCVEFDNAIYEDAEVIGDEDISRVNAVLSSIQLSEEGYFQIDGSRICILNIDCYTVNPQSLYFRIELQVSKDGKAFTSLTTMDSKSTQLLPVVPNSSYVIRGRLLSILNTPMGNWVYSDALTIKGHPTLYTPEMHLLDIPKLPWDTSTEAHAYAVAYSEPFYGTKIYSLDAGGNLNFSSEIKDSSVMGVCSSILAKGPQFYMDKINTLNVTLHGGSLSTVDIASLKNGANYALVGNEVIQFMTATLVDASSCTYVLSNFLRGRLGTESTIDSHSPSEVFLLLPSNISKVEIPFNKWYIDCEYEYGPSLSSPSSDSYHKITNNYTANFSVPYAVCHIKGRRNSDKDLTISWQRRERGDGGWKNYSGVPLSEEVEKYEVDVYKDSTIIRTLTTGTNSCVYLISQQLADFGAAQSSVHVKIYQISAKKGRGKERECTL